MAADNAVRRAAISSREFYDSLYERLIESRTFKLLVQEACGDDFNSGAACFSFAGRKEFDSFIQVASAHSMSRILELGSGYGDLCLALAERLPVHALGIDISPVAVGHAHARARLRKLVGTVEFAVADMNALSIDIGTVDAAFSLDAFHYSCAQQCVPVLAQLMRDGGVLRFTTWVDRSQHRQQDFLELKRCGFDVAEMVVTHDEMAYQARMYALTYAYRHQLRKEIGEKFVSLMLTEALHLSTRRVERCMVTAIRTRPSDVACEPSS